MTVNITSRFAFNMNQPTDVLLQFEAAMIPEQYLHDIKTEMSLAEHISRVSAQEDIGERIWVRAQGRFEVEYRAKAEIQRQMPEISGLARISPHLLPGEAVKYLFDSRYVMANKFQHFANAEFGDLQGGARICAMRDWVEEHFSYVPGSSTASTTALDSFVERRGICRDYAHVMVSLARASAIPARFVSCYDPGVTPQDFHAVAEVFLANPSGEGGTWQIVDATGMADPAHTVKIGVGRDAADVSFLTSFGMTNFEYSEVEVTVSGED